MNRGTLFAFYPLPRACPECRGRLATMTRVTRAFMAGPLAKLGITCYCVRCNSRYRATSRLRYDRLAWAGPAGRWIWWLSADLEQTLKAPAF